MSIEDLIKELDSNLIVDDIEKKENCIHIDCHKPVNEHKCPCCGYSSSHVHSCYNRTITDLPIQNNEVKLVLSVHKYFCENDMCSFTTFSEDFDFVETRDVRTKRLDSYIKNIGLRGNAMDAIRTLKEMGINISGNTVINIVKKTEIDVNYNAKNIGIDDFSLKKREIYNSIIVDNDNHKKLAIVETREQEDVVKTLLKFPYLETVTRDFSLTYKNSISEAHPNAKQIVDRFHILKNLTDDMCNYLKRTVSDRIKLIKGNDNLSIDEKPILTKRQQNKIDTANRKWEIIKEAKRLYAEDNSKSYIARKLGIGRDTVNKYLKRCKLKKLFFFDLDNIRNEDLKNDIIYYLNQNKELSNLIDIVKEFKIILFSKKPEELIVWIGKAEQLNIDELNSFINLIKSDIEAVKNAIIYDYSNGVTEGFNNKTKVIKRLMYGRCSQELLKIKVLA